MVVSLIAGGHILLTGVPGLGKTAMVKTFANILNLTSIISVYLNAAVQGAVIIFVAFLQRGCR